MFELHSLIATLSEHQYLLFFLAAVFGGEEILLPLAVLVGHGFWDFPSLFMMAFLGTLLSDAGWFLLGRHGIHKRKFFQRFQARFQSVSRWIRKLAKTEWGLLLITKFIYGTRIFTIIYVSMEGLSLMKFIGINAAVIFVWLLAITGGGWFIGRGSSFVLDVYERPFLLGGALVLLIILFHILRHWMAKYFFPSNLQK